MSSAFDLLRKFTDSISVGWQIATTKRTTYEYIIEDIELQKRDGALSSIGYYLMIGYRKALPKKL